MKTGTKILLIIIGIALFAGLFFASTYNRLVKLDEGINAAWAQVENVLQRRNDLVPNLVNTVKGYAKHEKEVFENIANARAAMMGARTLDEKVKANTAMDSALARLLAIAENYPQLKANTSFENLMAELAGTENRISVERKKYNEVVQAFNSMVRTFPTNIIAGMYGFSKKEAYFKAEEQAKQVPQVKF